MLWFRRKIRFRTFLFIIFIYLIVLYTFKDVIFGALRRAPQIFRSAEKKEVVAERPVEPPKPRSVAKRELLLLQMVYRHGHRAPFSLYPLDSHPASFWKEGLGMLTQLGRLQHFVLGDHIQKRYSDFITTNPTEVQMMSADSNRCQYGAYAFVAGLYRPAPSYCFSDELRWQPIPVRYVPEKNHRYVLSRRKCPVASLEEKELKASQEADEYRAKYRDLYQFWSNHSGKNIKDWVRAADLGKTLAVERDYNLSVPEWGLRYWEEFDLQEGLSYYWHFRSKLVQRYRAGPLIGYMIEKMIQKISGKMPEKKVLIYSAHGSNLACMMLALELYNMRAPPHAATIVFELWKEEYQQYSVRILYFNSSNPERVIHPPILLQLQGCEEFCPLEYFQNYTSDLIPEDWLKECNDFSQRRRFRTNFVSSGAKQKNPIALMMITAVLICVDAIVAFWRRAT